MKTKAVASDSRKKTVRNAVNRGVVRTSKKKVFRDVLLDLVGINFRICGISIDPCHPSDVFDVGYVSLERYPEAAINRGAAAGASVAIV